MYATCRHSFSLNYYFSEVLTLCVHLVGSISNELGALIIFSFREKCKKAEKERRKGKEERERGRGKQKKKKKSSIEKKKNS